MQKNQECPICGCKEIGKGRQAAQGSMMPVGSIWTGSAILSDICTDCGEEELGFTVNVGISTNKILAKMASELKKPDKVHTIFPDEIADKMRCLPIEELFMVGRATAKKLRSRAIYTIGTLAHADLNWIKLFLKSHGVLVWNYANGNDGSLVRENRRPLIKGIGNSTTIPFDVEDATTAHLVLLSLTETVTARLRQTEYCARLVSVSLRTNEFYSCSHQRKIASAMDSTNAIHEIACQLFDELAALLVNLPITTTRIYCISCLASTLSC